MPWQNYRVGGVVRGVPAGQARCAVEYGCIGLLRHFFAEKALAVHAGASRMQVSNAALAKDGTAL
jgi:hypothetical protein